MPCEVITVGAAEANQPEEAAMDKKQLEKQAKAWSLAYSSIRDFLVLYGVPEERAAGAASDIMDEDLIVVIDEEAR
jgi:hypothetical protein